MWFNEQIMNGLSIRKIILNFMPSWWYKNYGIGYGKPMIFDPDYRMNADREMRRIFWLRYGRFFGAGCRDPKQRVVLPDWDNTFYQSMLGYDVQFPIDQYPMGSGKLDTEELLKLKVPKDLWQVYPYNELKRQIIYMNDCLNESHPLQMKTRGILNECVQICGTDFYGDLLDDDCKGKVNHVFAFVRDVIKQQLLSNRKFNPNSFHIMMNCTAAVAGAQAYQSNVYSYDKALYDYCLRYNIQVGLHHCGKFDDFLDVYAPMGKLNFIEIGHASLIRPVVEQYPNAQIQYIVDTNLMRHATPTEVHLHAEEIRMQIEGAENRFHLSIPDLEYGTPDDNIDAIIEPFRE